METETLEAFDDQVDALGESLGAADGIAARFDGTLRRMQASLVQTDGGARGLERSLSRGLRKAFDGIVFEGDKLSDALRSAAQSMTRSVYRAAAKPVSDRVGGLLAGGLEGLVGGLLPFKDGAPFSQGRVMPFARGGVVTGPVRFPMRGGTGLMGEAGPEAILPLSRGADGRLGVRSEGGGGGRPVTVVMNITTPDVEGFRRSRSQIAAQMGRALGQGRRNR